MSSPNRTGGRGGLLLAGGAVFICLATLWPFTFDFHPIRWRQFVAAFALAPSTLLDLPRNIILFAPFGMGVASVLHGRGVSRNATLALTAAAGLAMTACVESLQVFLPGRTPNVSDIWSNACGAIAGVAVLQVFPYALGWLRTRALRGPSLTAAVMVSANVAVAVAASSVLMGGVVNQPFAATRRPLVAAAAGVGSPGVVRDVIVFNRAAGPEEAQQLLEGRVPSAMRESLVAGPDEPVDGAAAHPARIDRSFTIALTLDRVERAPAGRTPMLTLTDSDSVDRLAIAQDATRMALRWRSRFDGDSAARTELEFPGVLDPTSRSRRIVISVRGVTASVRTSDGAGDGNVLLGPEAALSALLRESDYWPLTLRHAAFWRALITFAAILFAAPALLLGAALRTHGAVVATACGILLPPLCTEAVVAINGAHALRGVAILTGAAVAAAGFVAGRLASRRFGVDDRTQPSAGSVPALTTERRQSTA